MKSEKKRLNDNNNNKLFSLLPLLPTFSVMKKNHHARNSHIYKLYEIKRYNLRPEMHHLTVRVNNNNNNNNNNNYAAVCKESCKLTNFSIQGCHAT